MINATNAAYEAGFAKPTGEGAVAVPGPVVHCCTHDNCNDAGLKEMAQDNKAVDGGARRDGDVGPAGSVTDTVKPNAKPSAAVSAAVGELTLVKVLALSLTGLMMELY